MIRRVRKLKSGKLWIGYYYNVTEGGRQKEIPLGTDLDEAKAEWALLERKAVEKPIRLMGDIFDKYEREIIPGKKPRTQQDNRNELRQLRVRVCPDRRHHSPGRGAVPGRSDGQDTGQP